MAGMAGRSTQDELARTRELVLAHGWNATAYQILNPGIARWFTAEGDGVLGYVSAHGYRIVAGAPVCPVARLPELVERFEAETRAAGRRACYFAAGERLAETLAQRGPFDRVLLGAQPVWDPAAWPDILASKASLRAQLSRARNKGVTITPWPAERATAHPALHRCLEEWLATRGLPPLHFLVEPETLERLYDRRVFVAHRDPLPSCAQATFGAADGDGRAVVGFLVASPIPQRSGWLIEQIVRGHGAPNGTAELMIDAAMRHLHAEGASYVTLGLSPLSQRSGLGQPHHALWLRLVLRWLRAHGRRFYDFEGLDAFKAKFLPESWEPIWAITGGHRVGPRTLYAIAGAFGQTSPILLTGRALGRALAREARWLRKRLPGAGPGV